MHTLPTGVPQALFPPQSCTQIIPEKPASQLPLPREASKSASPSNLATERNQLGRASRTAGAIPSLPPVVHSSLNAHRKKQKRHMLRPSESHNVTGVCGFYHGQKLCHAARPKEATLAGKILSITYNQC